MKDLYLIRHAKSDWEYAHLNDFDRPLNERGLRDAPRMAAKISKDWKRPELILSSPATRAYQTAQFFRETWNVSWNDFSLQESIYEATPEALLETLSWFTSRVSRIAIIGHNPGLSLLIRQLTGSDVELKTCCFAKVSTDHPEFKNSDCKLVDTLSPSDL